MKKNKQIYTVMVKGQNPEEILQKYDNNLKVEPYLKYQYDKSQIYLDNTKKVIKLVLEKNYDKALKNYLDKLEKLSSKDYYEILTCECFQDEDKNAWSDENPNGKWENYWLGDKFSTPLILFDKTKCFQSINKNIDWDAMNCNKKELYQLAWELFHEIKKPINETEEKILSNMKKYPEIISNFHDINEYLKYNCNYWTNSYADENGWYDIDDEPTYKNWIDSFSDKFVSKFKDDDLISIYEYER